ncbi:MAG TPA: tubulin-like doman-containing protein [Pyrinomonadaceae bacterium]|nr:tubulin-like doman-containing protein [Pyrinomonadaceae bacterium]
MSYYVIGIGGTGAKCVEAFIHLCVAGLMPDNNTLFSLFVDPDGSNGSLKRAGQLLQNYYDCKRIKLGQTDLFKNELRIAKPDVWSPLQNKPHQLDQFFNYNTLHNNGAAHLFDVLYSPKEKQTSLECGFRGHPSIGAAVMAASVELGSEEPWATLREQLRLDVGSGQEARVILFGSIFGGTGASGVPTIGRLVNNEFSRQLKNNRFKLGSVLMLPYFSFEPVKNERMRVDADTFLLSTQTALEYYHRQDELKICNAVYLLGNETLKPMRTSSIGGQQQENEPHLLEMYAALAAIHFFTNDRVEGYPHIARENKEKTLWSDLPHDRGFVHLKRKINQLAQFAFAYLSSYHPILKSINERGDEYRAPWYVNFFPRKKVDLKISMEGELKQVKTYCESFLLWLANIEQSQGKDNSAGSENLINFNAFAQVSADEDGRPNIKLKAPQSFDLDAFGNLLLPITKERPRALTELWEKMSNAKVKDTKAEGLGRFIRALYDNCGHLSNSES